MRITMSARRLAAAVAIGILPAAAGTAAGASQAAPTSTDAAITPTPGCQLDPANHAVKHVMYVGFDNVHFTRDIPNVPSDLEQMPSLLNFIKGNGTLLSNQHTPLISHTATDFLTNYSGVYGDRHGIPISNSFASFNANGSATGASAFAYWTDPLASFSAATDTTPEMVNENGVTAPAPWVPFTRAGCNVGNVATANMVLENNGLDIYTVFGPGSPEAAETAAQKTSDFVGITVHCAQSDALCSSSANAKPDLLPSEPGGYAGFQALYGHKYVGPALGGVNDLNGAPISGFPGFDAMTGAYSLGYAAQMQERGVPVTFAYLSDAHDCHASCPAGVGAFGSGEAGYVAYLHGLDTAFGTFFSRLATDGIDQTNTEFVFYSDENDHVAEASPTNPGCDGVTVACTWTHGQFASPPAAGGQLGEVAVNVKNLLAPTASAAVPYFVHNDTAPNFWVTGSGSVPGQNDPTVRQFERDLGGLTYVDPYGGGTKNLTRYLADQTEMGILHMVTADPARTPTVTDFAQPEDFVSNSDCTGAVHVCSNSAFAYIHGNFAPEVNQSWIGWVGPGVAHPAGGIDPTTWTDHVDQRPTLLSLVGLKDDYQSDGRVINELMTPAATPPQLAADPTSGNLARMLKKVDAPVYQLAGDTLTAATNAIRSTSASDATYANMQGQLQTLNAQRNAVAGDMKTLLSAAAFNNQAIDPARAQSDITQGQCLLDEAHALATGGSVTPCSVPPNVPETTTTILLPLMAMAGGAALVIFRRHRGARLAS